MACLVGDCNVAGGGVDEGPVMQLGHVTGGPSAGFCPSRCTNNSAGSSSCWPPGTLTGNMAALGSTDHSHAGPGTGGGRGQVPLDGRGGGLCAAGCGGTSRAAAAASCCGGKGTTCGGSASNPLLALTAERSWPGPSCPGSWPGITAEGVGGGTLVTAAERGAAISVGAGDAGSTGTLPFACLCASPSAPCIPVPSSVPLLSLAMTSPGCTLR